jgi:predicted RNA polymerase sigma factor
VTEGAAAAAAALEAAYRQEWGRVVAATVRATRDLDRAEECVQEESCCGWSGVATADIARAFLVSETTMAARVTRAEKKIAAARIP